MLADGCAHACEILGGDENRALAKIKIEDFVDRSIKGPDITKQMADCAIAVAGFGFRAVDGFVHRQCSAGSLRQPIEDQIESTIAGHTMHNARDGDRSRVHHRIKRSVGVWIEYDGVERIAARLDRLRASVKRRVRPVQARGNKRRLSIPIES